MYVLVNGSQWQGQLLYQGTTLTYHDGDYDFKVIIAGKKIKSEVQGRSFSTLHCVRSFSFDISVPSFNVPPLDVIFASFRKKIILPSFSMIERSRLDMMLTERFLARQYDD